MAKKRTGVTRREFLQHAALASGAVALTGLAPTAALAAQAGEQKIGSQLIGKLEGPSLILDPDKWPKKFAEAPMLAEMVKAGKLPPVEKRIPEEPMVVKPLQSVGKYGGTWRRGFTGPGDGENGNRIVSTDKILFWDYTGTKIMPCLAKDWKVSDDGRVVVITLRKGHKWSDGQPFTADDFVFWYEDVYMNKDIQPSPHPDFMVNGKPGRLTKRDDYTVMFEFPEPNYLFVDILAGSTAMGGGQATQQHFGRTMGAYMPAHYIKQFLPKYSSRDEVDRKAKAAGFDGWLSYIKNRWDWRLNPELPTLGPWKTVSPINTPTWGLERNPYYYGIDSEGNQLPYIDKISMGRGGEPGGPEPPRHRRAVRPAGAAHRHGEDPRLPGEPQQGQLRPPPRPGPERLGRHAADQSCLRGGSRDREVAAQSGLPPGALPRHRARPAQRNLLAGDRRRRLHHSGGQLAL